MKKIISIILVISVVCITFSFGANAATMYSIGEIDPDLYYAKSELAKLENGENLVKAYELIEAGVTNFTEEIDMTSANISPEALNDVFTAFEDDQPQHFHIDRYNYSTMYNPDTNTVVSMLPQYLITCEQYPIAKANFEKAAHKILSKIPTNLDEYETELAIHDALAKHIDYTHDVPDEHDAFGALVYGKAVCDGYAKAFQYLLYLRGIQSTIIEGEVLNDDGSYGGHAWNLVRIDGKYYYTDLTHNDPLSTDRPKTQVYHNYFNLTEKKMFQDRYADATCYPLPECTSTDAFYFEKSENKLADIRSIDEVAAKLIEGGGVAHVYVGDDADYAQWFIDNATDIYSKWGIATATAFSYSSLDCEYILMINCPNDVNTDGKIDSTDALILKQGLLGISEMTEANVINGESNSNGVIDSVDYLNLSISIIQ